MADTQFRVGLVGLGTVSNYHIPALAKVDGVRLVAGCDPVPARREYARRRWKLQNLYCSAEEMLEHEQLDALHILTPPPLHVPIAVTCLKRSCHCLIEKPIALDLREGELLERAADQSRRMVGVNHNMVCNRAFSRLRRVIDENKLEWISCVTVIYSMNSPDRENHWTADRLDFSILERAPHPLSLIIDLFGPVKQLYSRRLGALANAAEIKGILGWNSNLRCARGAASVFMLRGSQSCCTVSVLGKEGTVNADLLADTMVYSGGSRNLEPHLRVLRSARSGLSLVGQSMRAGAAHAAEHAGLRRFGDPFLESMRKSIEEFYGALREGREPKADLKAGLEVVKACKMTADSLI